MNIRVVKHVLRPNDAVMGYYQHEVTVMFDGGSQLAVKPTTATAIANEYEYACVLAANDLRLKRSAALEAIDSRVELRGKGSGDAQVGKARD